MHLAAQSRGVSLKTPKGEQLGRKLDMREPAADTNALRVFVVIAVTTAWTNNHPQFTFAAWIAGIVDAQSYVHSP